MQKSSMGYSVLVVDDDKELRKIYRALLERVGYTIFEASNGAEALQFLTTQKIVPDVMVMDMLMPLLNGDALIQRVRQTPALDPMKIIMLSAYPRYRESAQHFQADLFLVKPINPDDLLQALAALVPPITANERLA